MDSRAPVRLAPLTTFGVGGFARQYELVRTPESLIRALRAARTNDGGYTLFAGGSNVAFADGEFVRPVIQYHGGGAEWGADSVRVEAGMDLMAFITEAIGRGVGGYESLSGIPGTIGGALYGNAGAYGGTLSDLAVEVEVWDGERVRTLQRDECGFAYRTSRFKRESDWAILAARFRCTSGDPDMLTRRSREIVALRESKYPPGLKCPGSFFKNVIAADLAPAQLARLDAAKIIHGKVPAGYLLEAVGACGMHHGGLAVAPYHGNLIVNEGRATCREVRELAALLKTKVRDRFGIELEEEVRYLE